MICKISVDYERVRKKQNKIKWLYPNASKPVYISITNLHHKCVRFRSTAVESARWLKSAFEVQLIDDCETLTQYFVIC